MRESKIESYLVRQIQEIGGIIRKCTWIGRRGAPDRIVFFRQKVYLIELKAPNKKPEPHQKREHMKLLEQGADVRVIDSLSAIDTFITEIQ